LLQAYFREWPLTLVSVPKILSNPLVASNHLGNCVRQPNALSFDRDNNRDIPITPIMGCCECNHPITALTSRCHGMSVRIANVIESPHQTIEVLVVIVMLLIALPSALSAQQLPEPRPLRFDLTPFIGYRTSMSFPVEPHVTGMNPRVVLDASPSYGVSLGMRLANEGDLVEMRWARQDSYVHAEDITPQPLRQHMILDQFHGDFSHETPIEDWASWARPFVLASIGATHVSSSTNISFTRFSFGIGAGIRFYASRHLGFKIQAEWLPVLVDPHVAFICGSGCIVHAGGTASSQGEVFVGPILRF